MLTTLSIVSLDQGKIAPRYDIEPANSEDAAEVMADAEQSPSWNVDRSVLAIWTSRLVTMVIRLGSAMSHARLD